MTHKKIADEPQQGDALGTRKEEEVTKLGEYSYWKALKEYPLSSLKDVFKLSCAREAYLSGIVGGTAIGLTRYSLTRKAMSSCNYAVISFSVLSALYWEYCYWQSKQQRRPMNKPIVNLHSKELEGLYSQMKEKEKEEQLGRREYHREE